MTDPAKAPSESVPEHRYTADVAGRIEQRWQDLWEEQGTFDAPNPVGPLAGEVPKDKLFVQDMFPYPSGSGLHVGHPLGYIATDVFARFHRMHGRNVLHALGYDAFGLPAEQYAVQTGTHPRSTTEANIANMRRQLRRLGLGHDRRRSLATTDVDFYHWTQWIFLQIFNSWYDVDQAKARPIAELEAALARRHDARGPYVVVIDTDPYPSTEHGGAWWDVGVPEARLAEAPRRMHRPHVVPEEALLDDRVDVQVDDAEARLEGAGAGEELLVVSAHSPARASIS